jgi:hypothetical protein
MFEEKKSLFDSLNRIDVIEVILIDVLYGDLFPELFTMSVLNFLSLYNG